MTGQEIVDVYADGAVRETAWFEQYGDVDTAAAVLRLSGGALAVLTGTRHDPLGYDVRLEVFGTGDSIAVGARCAQPAPLGRAGRGDLGGHGYANFMERFEPAYRDELAAFVATVRDGGPSPCPLAEARAALVSRPRRRPVPRRAAPRLDRGGE